VIVKEATKVSTTIPQGNPVGYFSVVQEISIPVVMGTRIQDYKVFVAFGSG